MDKIKHKFVEVEQGLKLHIAEIGTGSKNVVVLVHGFPEIWYTWRHQMIALSDSGFRTIAPDFRGYGLSDPPPEPDKASLLDFVNDILRIIDFLQIPKVFVIGKDFGSLIAYYLGVLHSDRILGIVTMGVPYIPKGIPNILHKSLPEGFYIYRWRVPGRAESDFGRFDSKTVFRKIYILFSKSEIPIASEDQEIMDLVDSSTPLPPWFTEDDLAIYGASYEKSGFRTALQVPYRSRGEDINVADPVIKLPALFIMGTKDYVLKVPGLEDYLRSGRIKDFVPNLEIEFLDEGSHFVQEQLPEEVNNLILNFLAKQVTF